MTSFYILLGIVLFSLSLVAWLFLSEQKKAAPKKTVSSEAESVTSSGILKRVGLTGDTNTYQKNAPINPTQESFSKKSFLDLFKRPKKDLTFSTPNFNNPSPSFFSKIFSKLNSKKSAPVDAIDIPDPSPLPSLLEKLELERKAKKERSSLRKDPLIATPPPATNPAVSNKTNSGFNKESMTPLSKEEELHIEQDIQLAAELSELKEKYEKLDKLFHEKGLELDRCQNSLSIELKNRKDFNKVKDILEKEIKEIKEKSREAHAELNQFRMENENHLKRIGVLEAKATKLEKEIIAKEKEIENLNKRPKAPVAPAITPTPAPVQPEAPKVEIPLETKIKEKPEIAPETTTPVTLAQNFAPIDLTKTPEETSKPIAYENQQSKPEDAPADDHPSIEIAESLNKELKPIENNQKPETTDLSAVPEETVTPQVPAEIPTAEIKIEEPKPTPPKEPKTENLPIEKKPPEEPEKI